MPWMGLVPADARRLALLRRHLLPSPIVLEHVLALLGRKLLKLPIALEDLLALLGRKLSEVRVGLAQLLAPLGRKLTPSAHPLHHLLALVGREFAELFEVLPRRALLRRRHLLPLPVVVEHPRSLFGREPGPHAGILRRQRPFGGVLRLARSHR